MLNLMIRTIPHGQQRYPTVGDWQTPIATARAGDSFVHRRVFRDGIMVSDLGNRDYELLVAVHEMVEMHLCQRAGITDEMVTEFDRAYEAGRESGQALIPVRKRNRTSGELDIATVVPWAVTETSEPGDCPHAPYYDQHLDATAVERKLATVLGVDWLSYEMAINTLP